MQQIPLEALPNQTISFNVDGAYWQLKVYQTIQFMTADIYRNGQPVSTGIRCFGGIPLLQYEYMFLPGFGNFIFDSDADWTNFGTNCNLYYLNKTELQQFNEDVLSGST